MRNWTFRNFQNQIKPYSALISFGNFDLFSNFLLTKATKKEVCEQNQYIVISSNEISLDIGKLDKKTKKKTNLLSLVN